MQLWEVNGNQTKLADFTSHFSFQISEVPDVIGGHGIAFVLVNENATLSLTSYGGLLGLFAFEESALSDNIMNQVVAVEFDTFQNDWDKSKDHIGIDVNSIKSKSYTNVTDGFLERGTANVRVAYNSTTKNLSASLFFTGDSKSYEVSSVVDLSVALPERVRVGFTAATRTYIELHQIYSWSFSSSIEGKSTSNHAPPSPSQGPSSPPEGPSKVTLVAGITASLFAVILISVAALYCRFRSRKQVLAQTALVESALLPPTPHIEYSGPKRFSYLELTKATEQFDSKLKLGEGGFGDVYQGKLASSDEEVAVKRFKKGSTQGEKEFVSEVNVISMLRHRNLVQLKGWCHENEELLLVYDFMPNRSLDFHLFGKNMPLLAWPHRFNQRRCITFRTAVIRLCFTATSNQATSCSTRNSAQSSGISG